jgi:hypothetical protein
MILEPQPLDRLEILGAIPGTAGQALSGSIARVSPPATTVTYRGLSVPNVPNPLQAESTTSCARAKVINGVVFYDQNGHLWMKGR